MQEYAPYLQIQFLSYQLYKSTTTKYETGDQ